MNYDQFVCAMLECTAKKVSEEELVEKQEVLKNNGVIAVGLTLRNRRSQIAPIIYMEDFYRKYCLGASLEVLSDFFLQRSRNLPTEPGCNYCEMQDFAKIKDQVVYKLVNAKKNEKLLREVPHLPILDFAIVFYWMVPAGDSEYGSVLIRNSHMDLWKLPISVLYQCAKKNTPGLLPYTFAPLGEFIKNYSGEMLEESSLYILTNRLGMNGSAALLYPEMPGKIYKYIKSSYYLLPSSIHEFLVVPEHELILPENLKEMVQEVNATQVSAEEFLSDHIYYFDGNIITEM